MQTTPKSVFAHYLVAMRDYGGSAAGYERDIRDAIAWGIDGFALNCGDWNGGFYQADTASMFAAAAAVSPDGSFKLFFSADMSGSLNAAEIINMMTTYSSHPNYWRILQNKTAFTTENRPVLSTYAGQAGGYTTAIAFWNGQVLAPLRAQGIDPYFVPYFFATNPDGTGILENPTVALMQQSVSGLVAGLADGALWWTIAQCPTAPSAFTVAEAHTAACRAAGLSVMATVSPQYWGNLQVSNGRRYFEYCGGEGIQAQWNTILNTQNPDWIEIATWNDYGESYLNPYPDVAEYWPYALTGSVDNSVGYQKSRLGFIALNKYFAGWYKTGVQPAPKDTLYYFYRTHPASMVATADSLGAVTVRVTPDSNPVPDVLFVTTVLTAAAQLQVTSGNGVAQVFNVGGGMVHTRIPFQPGLQLFELTRNGVRLASAIGEPIMSQLSTYNFNMTSGFASAA